MLKMYKISGIRWGGMAESKEGETARRARCLVVVLDQGGCLRARLEESATKTYECDLASRDSARISGIALTSAMRIECDGWVEWVELQRD